MARPLPVTARVELDFRDPGTITPLVREGGLAHKLELSNATSVLLPQVRRLVRLYQGSVNSAPQGTEEFLDALLEKARTARLKKQLSGGSDLNRDEAILTGDALWIELRAYSATKRGRQTYPDLTYGCSRPK